MSYTTSTSLGISRHHRDTARAAPQNNHLQTVPNPHLLTALRVQSFNNSQPPPTNEHTLTQITEWLNTTIEYQNKKTLPAPVASKQTKGTGPNTQNQPCLRESIFLALATILIIALSAIVSARGS